MANLSLISSLPHRSRLHCPAVYLISHVFSNLSMRPPDMGNLYVSTDRPDGAGWRRSAVVIHTPRLSPILDPNVRYDEDSATHPHCSRTHTLPTPITTPNATPRGSHLVCLFYPHVVRRYDPAQLASHIQFHRHRHRHRHRARLITHPRTVTPVFPMSLASCIPTTTTTTTTTNTVNTDTARHASYVFVLGTFWECGVEVFGCDD